ncbi:MAG: DnaA/Hda family protein [Pseudomonadota bacterium]
MTQLTLDLGVRPAYGSEDFIVAESNRAAVAWIDGWPDWPSYGLAVTGPPGSGKTHLCQVWRQRAGARVIDPAALGALAPPELVGDAPAIVLDGLGAPGEPLPERPLLHLLNHLAEQGRHVLIAAREPPARWTVGLADLQSRLAALPAVAIGAPDDGLLGAVIRKLFRDRQLQVGREVVDYLLARMERSLSAAQSTVAALDGAALAGGRPITVALARAVLVDTA